MHALLRPLAALEPVVELARLGLFLLFVALVLRSVASRRKDEDARRRAARGLAGFALGVSTLTGLVQVEAWPFTTWALVHSLRSPVIHSWEIEAADASGRFWTVDPRVLQPLAPEEFGQTVAPLTRLQEADRRPVLRFLYARAEAGRLAVASGRPFPPNDWLLGRLSAPYHFTARRLWNGPSDVPPGPFVSVRLSLLEWDARERLRDGDRVIRRTLVGEYRPDA